MTVTFLLEYINLFIMYYDYHARHFITLLISCSLLYQAQNKTEIMGVSLLTTHYLINVSMLAMLCNTDFCLFMVLGDKLLTHCIYLTLYLGHA